MKGKEDAFVDRKHGDLEQRLVKIHSIYKNTFASASMLHPNAVSKYRNQTRYCYG